MKKLFTVALLTLLATGCTSAYTGACQTNGKKTQPYNDNAHYFSVNCTEYCSVQMPDLCRNSPLEMIQAVQDALLENDKTRCTKFGYVTGTEAMSNCLMKVHTNREATQGDQTPVVEEGAQKMLE
jgi:hypothetical protein